MTELNERLPKRDLNIIQVLRRYRWYFLVLCTLFFLFGTPYGRAFMEYCWNYIDSFPAVDPEPWVCSNTNLPSGADPTALSTQKLIDEHYNWHCRFGHIGDKAHSHSPIDPDFGVHFHFGDPGYGSAFLGFHKQLISDFDQWRDNVSGLGRIETWDVNNITDPSSPDYNPMPWGVPGSGVSFADSGSWISTGQCVDGTGRSGNGVDISTFTPCPNCDPLYTQFRVPPFGNLNMFTSADALGDALDSGWHGQFHGDIAASVDSNGNSCNDINPSTTSPRDAMFWRAHNALDEVHRAWQNLQPTDIVIVIDRSGSMAQPAEAGSSQSKMDAAKVAAEMFADLIEEGQGHSLGLISFSSAATSPPDLGLTAVNAGITGSVQAALGGISPGGSTAIGDGLLDAQAELTNNGVHVRKAILLLTDGRENVPPCLDGSGTMCLGTTNDIAPGAFGSTQMCVVGYGEATNLDEIVLRDLAERQAGLYTSGTGTSVQLMKFFVDCFADIFDATIASDPIALFPADEQFSASEEVSADFATELTFVLAWEEEEDPLLLEIFAPDGSLVDLSDPLIEFSSGSHWQIVRITLRDKFAGGGDWSARAVRERVPGVSQEYFISALAVGGARILPSAETFYPYTGESFTAKIRIPASYRPLDEYDSVQGRVTITYPLVGIGNLLAEVGIDNFEGTREDEFGDLINPLTSRLNELEAEAGDPLIPTDTQTVALFDDGTNGDRFANNNYWTHTIPGIGMVEGRYQLHYLFNFQEGDRTFTREVNETIYVEVKIDPDATQINFDPIGTVTEEEGEAVVVITPTDQFGNLLGPGRVDNFELSTAGGADIVDDIFDDGQGSYVVTVAWSGGNGTPTLTLSQNEQPRLRINLLNGDVTPIEQIVLDDVLPPVPHVHTFVSNISPIIEREVSNTHPAPGDVVTVTVTPEDFETWVYIVEEDIGSLEYNNVHDAAENPLDTVFIMHRPTSFTYELRIPESAQPGDTFTITGRYWDNFAMVDERTSNDTVLEITESGQPPTRPGGCPASFFPVVGVSLFFFQRMLVRRGKRREVQGVGNGL